MIFDTASYEKHRLEALEDVDVVVLCFAVNGYKAFRRTRVEWAQRIRARFPGKPVILVGTKTDIRDDLTDPKDVDFVDDVKAAQVADVLGAQFYQPCSAKTMVNADRVFTKVVIAAIAAKRAEAVKGITFAKTINNSFTDLSGYVTAIPSFNPVALSKKCYPPLKQSVDNAVECWKNPSAFCTLKRRLRFMFPCMSPFIPVDPQKPKEERHAASPKEGSLDGSLDETQVATSEAKSEADLKENDDKDAKTEDEDEDKKEDSKREKGEDDDDKE
ncbi:hypothetical protein L596_025795 [Steinernema carpocapsae]|uniref:Ras family protein n=1 Tax=Steinernema carpocapsae TaxID=34508 RepID=A0A4U5M8X5_STECR|nr:hypothetical protein L596_025795 [Steinernema carpocapsae]